MKNVEGMPNFLENWKEINSEMRGKRECILFWKRECFNWRERIEGRWVVTEREVSSDQFLKKTLFGLMKLQGQIAIFYKTPFPRLKELGKSILTYLMIQHLFQY